MGDPAAWPQSLQTAIGMVLGNGQACNLIWGRELIIFYNDAYRPLLGSCIPDGIGMPYPKFRPDIWPFIEGQIMASFAGEATTRENIKVLTRRHGGSEEAYFTLSCSPVYDENSSVAGVVSHMFETTKAVHAQQALEHENSLLRRGLNHLPQMVWATLPDGSHDFYNDPWYEFTGVVRGSTHGDGWNEMFHPEDRERAWSIWRHSLRTGEAYEIEYRLKHKEGGYRWTLGRALPERDAAGEIVRWYGTCTDIHEHVRAREELRALQLERLHVSRASAMGSMAAILAHEVNQPLTAAANFAAGLKRQLVASDADLLLEGINGVEGAVLRAGDIVRRLRQLVDGQDPQREHVQAAELVHQAQHLLREECAEVTVRLVLEEGASLDCDPTQIQQVLTNLIRNACEAVKDQASPSIAIRTRLYPDRIRFTVEDNGVGLPKGGEYNLFEVSKPSKKGGMGIGLAISRAIVEAHAGIISAEDLMPGGARFYFDLPTALTAA